MTVLEAIREVQIPLLAAMLLGGCTAKLARTLRPGAGDKGAGPTVLFPMRMRLPLALTMCAVEAGLALGLILTAGSRIGAGAPATCVRLGTFLLFLVATSALIELRQTRPDAGCGCFGDFSTAPVSGRTLARSVLLAIAALATLGLRPIEPPASAGAALELIIVLCVELVVIGILSPEVGEGLIRLGYSEPCELRYIPAARTVAALRRSKAWRRYSGLVSSGTPSDVWRELCWRYVVYPGSVQGRRAEIVFAVFLQHRRPAVHVAVVDAATGLPFSPGAVEAGTPAQPSPGGMSQPSADLAAASAAIAGPRAQPTAAQSTPTAPTAASVVQAARTAHLARMRDLLLSMSLYAAP